MAENLAPLNDPASTGLSEFEIKMLDFERTWWRHAGAKESSIKELFNLTPPFFLNKRSNYTPFCNVSHATQFLLYSIFVFFQLNCIIFLNISYLLTLKGINTFSICSGCRAASTGLPSSSIMSSTLNFIGSKLGLNTST